MAKDERLMAHLHALVGFFDADDNTGAFQYAKNLPPDEARRLIESLRTTADAVTVAAFPESTEAGLIMLAHVTG
jgi:hypothetical protein